MARTKGKKRGQALKRHEMEKGTPKAPKRRGNRRRHESKGGHKETTTEPRKRTFVGLFRIDPNNHTPEGETPFKGP